MVALPKTVLEQIRMKKYPSKFFSLKEYEKQFALNGYGKNKAYKWLNYFTENEILVWTDNDTLTCPLWSDALWTLPMGDIRRGR